MTRSFCKHLDGYGAQYSRTEARYRHCIDVLDRMVAEGPAPELVATALEALRSWAEEDRKLREMLVDAVRAGRVRVPRSLLMRGGVADKTSRRVARESDHPVCAACRRPVSRLTYPEWKFAHNGAASFRGAEFPPLVAAPV